MSPDMILGMQHRFGENFDVKGLIWKNSLKKRPVLAQLQEIQEKKVPKLEEQDIDPDVLVDLRQKTLEEYKNCKPDAFTNAMTMLEVAQEKRNLREVTHEVLKEVVSQGYKVP